MSVFTGYLKNRRRNQLLILGGCVVVVALTVFAWSVRVQQQNQQRMLAGQLTVATKKLTSPQLEQLNAQKAELEKRLQALAKAKAYAVSISNSSKSVAATDMLMEAAAALGLEVKEVKTSGSQKEKIQGVEVVALPLSLTVTGEFWSLVNFVGALSKTFPTGVVKSVQIDIPDIPVQGTAPGSGRTGLEKSSVKIELVVYSYQDGENGQKIGDPIY